MQQHEDKKWGVKCQEWRKMSSAPSWNCPRTESCERSTATGSMPPDLRQRMHVRRKVWHTLPFFNQVECRWGQNLPPPHLKLWRRPCQDEWLVSQLPVCYRHDDIVLPRVCFARRDKQQCWLIDMRQCQVQQGILLLDGQSSLTFPSLSCVALRIRLRSHLSDVSFRLLTRSKSASHSFDNDCRARSLFFVRVTCATILFSYFLEVFQILQ